MSTTAVIRRRLPAQRAEDITAALRRADQALHQVRQAVNEALVLVKADQDEDTSALAEVRAAVLDQFQRLNAQVALWSERAEQDLRLVSWRDLA